jgi:hypothetical protein
LRAIQLQRLFQAVKRSEFDISETFRLPLHLVLHDANIGYLASTEEVGNITLGSIEGKVAKMGGIRGFGGKRKGFANSIVSVISA